MPQIVHKLNFSEGVGNTRGGQPRKTKVTLLEQKWRLYNGEPKSMMTQKTVWSGTAEDLLELVRRNGLDEKEAG